MDKTIRSVEGQNMKSYEELNEETIKRTKGLTEEFEQELASLTNIDIDGIEVFKKWVIEKLAFQEVLLINNNEQQENIINFLKTIVDSINNANSMMENIKKREEAKDDDIMELIMPQLNEIYSNDQTEIKNFLNAPNPLWAGLTPMNMIMNGKIAVVVKYVNKSIPFPKKP